MMMNSSARVMGSAYQAVGSVTAIPTVKMDQMNTTLAHPSLAAPTISSVTTSCVSRQAGSAMVTTTAWTWVMNRIAPRLHFTVHPASGSAPPTSCALIWIKCVMARGTVPMEQMSHPFAVSTLSKKKKKTVTTLTLMTNEAQCPVNDTSYLISWRPKWLQFEQWRLQSHLLPRTVWSSVQLSIRLWTS